MRTARRGFQTRWLHGRSNSHRLAGYVSYRNDNDHFCLPCSKRCFHSSVWANRKNAVACFLTPERKREETANIKPSGMLSCAPWWLPVPLLDPQSHVEIAVEKGKNLVSIKTGATHSNRWAVHVARASPNFPSHIKAYFIALSKNWDFFVLLVYHGEFVGSCLSTFRIVHRSQLHVSRGPRRMQGNQANNQATNKRNNRPTDRPTDRLTDRPTNQPINHQPTNQTTNQPTKQTNNQPTNHQPTNQPTIQPTKELTEGGYLRFAQVDVPRPI